MSKSIIVNPEIASGVLKNKEDDLYILWLLAKKIDVIGSGIVAVKEIINFAKIVLNIKSNYVYEKIEKGIDKYWRKPFGKYGCKSVCLLSPNKIIQRLKPQITRCKPVSVPLSYIQSSGKKTIRGLLISIVAGRYTDNRPISMYSLIHNIGLSESTIRNALANSNCINSRANYIVIAQSIERSSLSQLLQNDKEPWACKIILNNGIFQLLKQQANSYDLDFFRLPLKSRPNELKKNDKRLFAILEPKRYNNENDLISFKTYHQ